MQQESTVAPPLPNTQSQRALKPWSTKIIIASIFLIVGISAVVPFYFSRYDESPGGARVRRLILTHDLWMHLHTMEQFDNVLRSGVIYPRWVADINHGYGILTLIYYPPGFFYLTSAVNAVVGDWINTLFVISALALVASGLALYLLARTFYGTLASTIAAVFYMIMPTHMSDLYWRGGLPQFVGYVFPPLVIYFAYRLGREGKPAQYAGLALFYGLHLLTHLPVSLMFTYALAFYAAVWVIKERDWRIGARLGGGMALGLLLSAVYWLPAALETKYAYEFATDLFPYHRSYITLLPIPDELGFHDFFVVLNIVFVLSTLVVVVVTVSFRFIRRLDQASDFAVREWTPLSMWVVMAIATTFMCTSFSILVSKLLPKIQVAVPAWRWLALAGMFAALLVAAAIEAFRRPVVGLRANMLWACRAAIVLVIAINVVFSIGWTIVRPLSNPTYNPTSTSSVVESSWTPKASTHPQELPDSALVQVEPEGGAFEVTRWLPQDREVQVKVDTPSLVRLKTYNFPGWTAKLDGKEVPMQSDKDGIQQVEVPPGIHRIQASFRNTPPRVAGSVLSIIAMVLMAGMFIQDRLKRKQARAFI